MSSGKITLEQRKASLHYHVQEYRKRRVIIDTDAACEADDPFAIAKAHWMFESTHPFSDGNGRIGRLVMFKELL